MNDSSASTPYWQWLPNSNLRCTTYFFRHHITRISVAVYSKLVVFMTSWNFETCKTKIILVDMIQMIHNFKESQNLFRILGFFLNELVRPVRLQRTFCQTSSIKSWLIPFSSSSWLYLILKDCLFVLKALWFKFSQLCLDFPVCCKFGRPLETWICLVTSQLIQQYDFF